MAHNVETMAWANDIPWHGLGVEVESNLTPLQMLEAADLNWTVSKRPSYTIATPDWTEDVELIQAEDTYHIVRDSDNTILSHCGKNYVPFQNERVFEFFKRFTEAGQMTMETAGSLRNGKEIWGLAKISDDFELVGGDEIKGYLLINQPHVAGKSMTLKLTPIRVVCNNTLTLSLGDKNANSVKVGHRVQFNPEQVKTALGIASEKLNTYKEMAEFLGSKRFTADSLIEYYNTVFPRTADKKVQGKGLSIDTLSRNARLAYDAIDFQPGAGFAQGSWWQAFNSVTFVTDHVQGRNNDNRLYSSWYGQNQLRKKDAMKTALKFAEAS